MASIRKAPRTPGRWEVRYRDPAGRQRTKTFSSKADAKAFSASITVSLGRGDWRDPSLGRITLSEWTERYYATTTHKRASTEARDRRFMKSYVLPSLGSMPLASITPMDIGALVKSLSTRLSPSTVVTIFAVLRAALNAAVSADILIASPARGIRLPKPQRREPRFLEPAEFNRLADEFPPEYRALAFVAGVLGLRLGEFTGLTVRRIDFFRKQITINETIAEVDGRLIEGDVKSEASRRTLSVPQFVLDELSRHLTLTGRSHPDDLVFSAPRGGPLRGSHFRKRVLKPAIARAGIKPLTIHDFRHAAVGFLIQSNEHIQVIKERMGHSTIRVTSDTYGSVLPAVDTAVTSRLEALLGPGSVRTEQVQSA